MLIAAIGALCGVIVYMNKRQESQHDQEVKRLVDGYDNRLKEQASAYDERIKDLKALAFRATETTDHAVSTLSRPLDTR